ncbi:MAG: nucleoside triphosphate pyrophosphohydrolase [Nitrospirae bacterium]|nr:MAG: nucleoside triphosphate pyrophosphohydrolase [Nitrospirota bacterium]
MSERFDQIVAIMARLRGEGGCPWDRKQTRESLKPYLIEEAYEVLETIEAQDDPKLKEELGDVLLQVLFHAQIGREHRTFTIEDVLETLADKLIRRHPHVFGEAKVDGADEVVHRWEEIKRQEKSDQSGNGDAGSALDGVPKSLPTLLRAYQLQVRAARVGFDWPQDEAGYAQVVGKVHEELREVEEARADAAQDATEAARRRLQDEVGDVLFALVNLARLVKVNPEEALRGSANRFAARFTHMEQAAKARGRSLSDMTLAEMDRLWDEAKTAEGNKAQP